MNKLAELKKDLLKVDELEEYERIRKFVAENKFKILREDLYRIHDICPSCEGKGYTTHSIYHNDAEDVDCTRCATTGRYNTGHLTQFLKYIPTIKESL
jgi:hypothetical protein